MLLKIIIKNIINNIAIHLNYLNRIKDLANFYKININKYMLTNYIYYIIIFTSSNISFFSIIKEI